MRLSLSAPLIERMSSPKPTLPATVIWGHSAYDWNTIPVLRLLGGVKVTSLPLKAMDPPVGSMNPAIIRSRVVLPQPEGPSRKNSSPGGIDRVMRSTAVVR